MAPQIADFDVRDTPINRFQVAINRPFARRMVTNTVFLIQRRVGVLSILCVTTRDRLPRRRVNGRRRGRRESTRSYRISRYGRLITIGVNGVDFRSFRHVL